MIMPSAFSQNTIVYKTDEKPKYKKKVFKDSLALIDFVSVLQKRYYNKGYLDIKIDTIKIDDDTLVLDLKLNEEYFWDDISITIKDDVSEFNRQVSSLSGRKVNLPEFDREKQLILRKYENSGYPFVAIKTDSLKLKNNRITVNLEVEPGSYVLYNSIILNDSVNISRKYLANLLKFQYGKPYNETDVQLISKKLSRNIALNLDEAYYVDFLKNDANLHLNLSNKKSNQFNGIIGFQPDQENNSTQFTGEFYLKLANSFKIAEIFEFEWKSLEANSQEILLDVKFPYIYLSDFGANGFLNIEKFDTNYVTTITKLSVLYTLNSNSTIRVNSKRNSSNLLGDVANKYSEYKLEYYGLGVSYSSLNQSINPTKGIYIDAEFNIGKKELKDSTKKYNARELLSHFKVYLPLTKAINVNYSNKTGFVDNELISENEKFKIGGIKTLRGFNEKSIIAQSYLINSLEISYIPDITSRGFVFYDFAVLDDLSNLMNFERVFYSFGAGIDFSSKAGIFSLVYAVGKQPEGSFLLKDAKIHFGYISRF